LHRQSAEKAKDHSKKKTRAYKERDEEKGADYERAMSVYKKEDIVCVNESGIDRHLHRQNARSAKGKKVFGFVAGKKFQRTNIVAGYVNGEAIAECIYNCTTDDEVFNAWVK
jgi:hypothetical protein